MTTQQSGSTPTFTVLDAMDAPHGGRILRLRLQEGTAPSIKALKGAHLRAVAPDGRETRVRVEGFPLFGGRPSNDRLARTGRIDVHVLDDDEGPPVGLRWAVSLGAR
jgi:hypothetical protein